MNKQFFKNRRAKYGGVSILVTALLLACILLANALFGMLAARYGWYIDLHPTQTFPVGEKSTALVKTALDAAGGEAARVELHFCDNPENLEEGKLVSYLYATAKEFAARDGRIELFYHDILLDPSSVAGYLTSTVIYPETGEETERPITLQKTSLIVASGEYHRAYSTNEFFQWESGSSSPTAYAGEKKLASAILRAVAPATPIACLTNNHGEAYYDYEILYLLDDAGYRLDYIDLTQSVIPEACSLIVCFNPNNDLAERSALSGVSEKEILDDFLSTPGHALLVFLENRTPELPVLDAYLSEWGVSPCYSVSETANYRYMIRDEMGSLTSDGYTISGKTNGAGLAEKLTSGISRSPVFSGASGFRPAAGFVPVEEGTYQKGDRRVTALYESGSGAVAYANGKAVDADPVGLLAYAEQELPGGVSRVSVVFSVTFATEEWIQPAAYGNADVLLRLTEEMSGNANVGGIPAVSFPSSVMHGLSRGARIGWTLALTLTPAVILAAVAIPVLLRRKYD